MATKKEEMISVPMAPIGNMEMIQKKLKDVMNLKNLRGIPSFFGIGEEKPFNIPTRQIAMIRTRKNVLYFATNYACVAVCVAFLSM